MAAKRIVSLLPSATELLYELGAQDALMAVTHRCDYPKEAQAKPRATSSPIDPESLDSAAIDAANSQMQQGSGSAFVLDEKVVRSADPDLIISQNTCQVCAPHKTHVARAAEILGKSPALHQMDPHTIKDILGGVAGLAALVGKEERGRQVAESLQKRIGTVRQAVHGCGRPSVAAVEWVDPLYTAGHWVPDMIHIAGGSNLISKPAERSYRMQIPDIAAADPDYIVIMPCGFGTDRAASEYDRHLAGSKEWGRLRAVQDKNVFAVDADSHYSKPSTRTITGIEIMARILHPKEAAGIPVPEGAYRRL